MVRVHLLLPVRNFALRNNKKEVEQRYFLFYCLLWLVASLLSCKWIVRNDVALRFTALTAALRTDESTCFYHSIIQANQKARLGFFVCYGIFLFNRRDFIVNNCILMTQIQRSFLDCRMIRRLRYFFVQLVRSLSQTKYTKVWKWKNPGEPL